MKLLCQLLIVGWVIYRCIKAYNSCMVKSSGRGNKMTTFQVTTGIVLTGSAVIIVLYVAGAVSEIVNLFKSWF